MAHRRPAAVEDLSKNEDLTAVVACWRDDDILCVWPFFFCPEDNLRSRGERHGVDYLTWAEEGFILPTPGNTVDLRAVEEHIRELCARFAVREIAFDPTYGRSMMANLVEDGLPAVEFRQGWVSMAPAVKELERVILARDLTHGGHPVLRWNFGNVQVETDKAGNRMFHKGKSGNKIDGAVACTMAVGRAALGIEASVYDSEWWTDDMGYPKAPRRSGGHSATSATPARGTPTARTRSRGLRWPPGRRCTAGRLSRTTPARSASSMTRGSPASMPRRAARAMTVNRGRPAL